MVFGFKLAILVHSAHQLVSFVYHRCCVTDQLRFVLLLTVLSW